MTGTDPALLHTPPTQRSRHLPSPTLRPATAAEANPSPNRAPRIAAWIALVVFTSLLLFTNLGNVRVLTRHEIFVAQTAREMLLTGDFLLPHFGTHPRLVKPPLAYWVTAAVATLSGGVGQWSARIPFALAGLALTLLVARMARDWFGPRVGLLAGFVQASAVYMGLQARLAEVDMLLALLVAAALYLFAKTWYRRADSHSPLTTHPLTPSPSHLSSLIPHPSSSSADASLAPLHDAHPSPWRPLAFFTLLGLTVLAKGPVGFCLVVLTCAALLGLERNWRGVRLLCQPLGLALLLALTLTWPLLVLRACPQAISVWTSQSFNRFVGDDPQFNEAPALYYFYTIPWLLLPWTPFVLLAARSSLRLAWREHGPHRFLWLWTITQVAFLNLSAGKHHHYVIPALPPMSIIAALGVARFADRFAARHWRLPRWPILTVTGSIAALAAGDWLVSRRFPQFAADLWILGPVVTVGVVLGVSLLARVRLKPALCCALATIAAVYIYVFSVTLPRLDLRDRGVRFAEKLNRELPPDTRLYTLSRGDFSLVFYLRWPLEQLKTLNHVAACLRDRGSLTLLADTSWQPALELLGPLTELDRCDLASTRGWGILHPTLILWRLEPHATAERQTEGTLTK